MSIMETDIQWFIARDGKQHGPVSDLEMRKLVELGHLRSTDLIWRQGFPDWRPAPAVFVQQPQVSPFAAGPPSASQTRPRPAYQSTAPRYEPTAGRGAAPGASSRGGPVGTPGGLQPGPRPGAMQPASARGTNVAVSSNAADDGSGAGISKSRARRVVSYLLLLAILGGGGWFAFKNKDQVIAIAKMTSSAAGALREAAPETKTAEGTSEAEAKASASAALTALDKHLQQIKHWSVVRQEFGEWYEARIREAARLMSEKKANSEIAAYLAMGLVELRRAHADKALAASSETLRSVATAFQANIGRLGQEGSEVCMAFILKGEASAPVVEIIENPAKNTEINAHFAAIFGAISEGSKTPATHTDPTEADYQLLVAQLTKLGWAPNDLQLFADPKGVTKTTPERYCTMMQQFFQAHLAVEDAAAQERLLYRTLKLVVAG